MSVLLKAVYRFNVFTIKTLTILSQKQKKKPKIHTESEIPQTVRAILNNKNKARSITTKDGKTYYKAIPTKTAWYYYKNNHNEEQKK